MRTEFRPFAMTCGYLQKADLWPQLATFSSRIPTQHSKSCVPSMRRHGQREARAPALASIINWAQFISKTALMTILLESISSVQHGGRNNLEISKTFLI